KEQLWAVKPEYASIFNKFSTNPHKERVYTKRNSPSDSARPSLVLIVCLVSHSQGNLINYSRPLKTPEIICKESNKIVNFIDLADNEGYTLTTLRGVTSYDPHYAMLVVNGITGAISITIFHLGQFVVTTDASNKGIGAILSQIINGEERVIAYASRTLTSGESNYSATQLELLSIIHHLDKFRHYLVGRKFKLRSDHKSLQYLQTFKKPTGILARWILKIQDLDYEFEHLKGKQNAP
ncbi:hypothetical protein QYM36_012413, partial [Artemia franciscana]